MMCWKVRDCILHCERNNTVLRVSNPQLGSITFTHFDSVVRAIPRMRVDFEAN